MAFESIKNVAGSAVGYTALFILGTPIAISYHASYGLTHLSEKMQELKDSYDKEYKMRRELGHSVPSSSIRALNSLGRESFPDLSKRIEDYFSNLEERFQQKRFNVAKDFHQGSLRL